LSIDDEISAIKKRIESARLQQARAEVAKEAADKEYAATIKALSEQFGVDNSEQVRAKLAELQASLTDKLAQVRTTLDSHKL
jgi:hypothetical protein